MSKNVLLSNGFNTEKPDSIEFHKRLGWIISNSISKAFLGKVSINGKHKIEIGNRTYLSGTSKINGNDVLRIGNFCSIANRIEFFTSNINHPKDYPTTYNLHSNMRMLEDNINIDLPNYSDEIKRLKNKNFIYIENDVWIGKDTLIFPSVTIPNGCIIGAKSIITKNLEPYGIYAGSPAKLIIYRFSKEIIKQLLKIQWWKWDMNKIRKNKKYFDTKLTNYSGDLSKIIIE